MTINRLNQGTTNQVLVKAISGQTTNLLELQDSSGNVVSSIGPTGALGGTITDPYAGAWISWTPTYTGFTAGNSTISAKYKQIGKSVFFKLHIVRGSTGSITGDFSFSLPFTGTDTGTAYSLFIDNGTNDFVGLPAMTPSVVFIRAVLANSTYAQANGLSSTIPFTWATSDSIICYGFYEVP